MVELQLDHGGVFGEIAAGVHGAHFEAEDFAAFALGFHDHLCLPINTVCLTAVCLTACFEPLACRSTVGWIQCKEIFHEAPPAAE